MKLPKVLEDIQTFLKSNPIAINGNVEGEGRGGSLLDEGSVKRALFNHPVFRDYTIDVPARGFADIIILDYDKKTKHAVNIKTSIGSCDNATSKGGFLYAFTDLEIDDIPKSMNWIKFENLLQKHQKDIPHKDYYFLCIDKNDSTEVLIRGCKSIRNWIENANPSNLLQINWNKEKKSEPVEQTHEEARETICGGLITCQIKHNNNLPESWQRAIINGS